MSEQNISRKIVARAVVIKMMDGSVIRGKLNLHREEQLFQRLSELFTQQADPFVVVFEATFEGNADRIFFVNKRNILWASPAE
jgi:hypothetical protein